MDEKSNEHKPKISRSRARHLRRKRLIIARKAAENTLNIDTNISIINKNISNPSEDQIKADSLENQKGLSKSKARRLRKKNKKGICQSLASKKNQQNQEINERFQQEINEKINSSNKESYLLIKDLESIKKIDTNINPQAPELIASQINLQRNIDNNFLNNSDKNFCSFSSNSVLNKDLIISVEDKKITENGLRNINDNVVIQDNISLGCEIVDSENVNKCYGKIEVSIHKDKKNPLNKLINNSNINEIKMNNEEKSREKIKAEREAKKLAKAAAKNKTKNTDLADKKESGSSQSKNNAVNNTSRETHDNQQELQSITNEMSNLSSERTEEIIFPVIKAVVKSKSELRAERRAKQEAQRAAKELEKEKKMAEVARKPSGASALEKKSEKVDKTDDEPKKMVKKTINQVTVENNHEINLFKHLYHEREQSLINLPAVNSHIHPAIVRLGVQYASKIIVGSNARCIAFLSALKQLIKDYERPSQADFTRGLEASFQESMAYLHHCRPSAVSMLNALRHLKWRMTQLSNKISDEEAKNKLQSAVDLYISEQILLADEAISQKIRTKIYNNDVILTYGYSSVIQKVLCDAYDAGRKFHVIVVDGRPWLEGKELLRRLAKHGVSCSYVLINALSFVMPEISKVFLGAHAILANGAVMSRAGTAQVALMAKAFNVPVLFACETHKSCERVQTDSIVYNEIGDADELVQNTNGNIKKMALTNWRAKKSLNLLNIIYDVTPADLVTAVVTELAILPCTSVPVILRIKPSEI